jgi:hypothetical protein
MSNERVHVPEPVLRVLRETAELAGDVRLAEVIGAAVWAFARQHESVRDALVLEYCLRGPAPATRTTFKERFYDLACSLGAFFRRRAAR